MKAWLQDRFSVWGIGLQRMLNQNTSPAEILADTSRPEPIVVVKKRKSPKVVPASRMSSVTNSAHPTPPPVAPVTYGMPLRRRTERGVHVPYHALKAQGRGRGHFG